MSEKPKILIVGDKRIIAREMRYKLESMGYDVPAIVSSGEEAVKKAEELHPDLVLMDIILQEEMDGVEAAGQIRTRFNIPVVYVTANVSDARLEDITRSEPFGCLFKPFEDIELHAAIEMALHKYKMEKKLRTEMNFTHALIQASPAFFVAIGADGKTIMMNESMLHALGYTADEVAGKNYMTSFVPEKDHEMLSGVFGELTKPHEATLNENHLLTRDGSELLIEWHGRSVFNEHGEFEYFFGTGIDITEQKRAEKALRDSEKKYRTLAETTKDITFTLDLDGNFTYISPVIEKLTGYSWQEIVGHSFTEFIAPEYVKSTIERFKEGLAGKDISLYEIEMRHKDGGTVPIELNVTSLPDATGKTTGRIGIARDITDRKQAEEALRESEEKYRLIFGNAPLGILHFDEKGIITACNDQFVKIIGSTREVLVGLNMLNLPDKDIVSAVAVAINGKPGYYEDDYHSVTANKVTPIRILFAPIIPEKGEAIGGVGIIEDITERRQAEATTARLVTVIEQAAVTVVITDLEGDIVYVNPDFEISTGYAAAEVLGQNPRILKSDYQDTLFYQDMWDTLTSGHTWHGIFINKRKSGELYHEKATIFPIKNTAGEIINYAAVKRDITDRKKAEEEIKSHQEHLAFINQILRHDLTNDLVVIQSAINLYNKSPEEKLLREISSHAGKSIELINRMRELESFISRHRELNMYEMRDTIDEVIKSYPSIDFEIEGKARVMADDSLSSVIDNIIRNAVIHGKTDRIIITTGRERDMCEVRIADNGTGISDDIKERIFEKGFMHGDTGHTGLGLHIVKKVMESYGGYTWAEDNEPKGTVIVLRFRRVK